MEGLRDKYRVLALSPTLLGQTSGPTMVQPSVSPLTSPMDGPCFASVTCRPFMSSVIPTAAESPAQFRARLLQSSQGPRRACYDLAIGPPLDIADREPLEKRIGVDQLFACGPTGCVSGGHKGRSIGIFCAGQ